ncbi:MULTISPECIES: ABC transporter permease [unclassified Paenibacillus]|uniref:ABC transporter permease n=1 Tax=unclassified Paenibacillus TaxID=185978 RepID=UPI001AE77DB3|nr:MULTISPECIES: ABC transporter permease [unclassified Paenibacillus]MBP1157472.1 ABC-2 type transport system permease protein [Paenibacillus sp. PvP091]MBP1171791.1 ABC-2 type transport system permease protein [Paenibacillus sp. PvR098]MBP2438172.1 ABC-2 type transport system permease protein [Paenibacillus sp. PvP052]
MLNDFKEIKNYREMLVSIVRRDLRSRYKGSFLGFLWTFVNPLLQLIVYSIVFPYILKINQENYPMFLFVALLPWIYFTSSLQGATTSIVSGANLVKKIYFPRMILPLAVVGTNLMNYIYGLIIVFSALLFMGIELTMNVLWLPVVLLIHSIFILGLALIFSALYVKFRDLEHIVGVVTFVWFYLTPIVFPITIFPDNIAETLGYNPMVPIINSFRDILLDGKQPDWSSLSYSLIVGLLVTVIGLIVFRKCQKTFAEDL